MNDVYRQISPRRARRNDLVMTDGYLEQVTSVEIYPPAGRSPERDRPPLCPIRSDWWAVAVHTASGDTRWLAEPDLPGLR